jgi:hypothetical protein
MEDGRKLFNEKFLQQVRGKIKKLRRLEVKNFEGFDTRCADNFTPITSHSTR